MREEKYNGTCEGGDPVKSVEKVKKTYTLGVVEFKGKKKMSRLRQGKVGKRSRLAGREILIET